MLPIAYDRQQASSTPENPDVIKILTMSFALGATETVFSMIFAYGCDQSGIFQGSYPIENCPKSTQAAIWLQMFISAELLIFVARAPKLIIFSLAPSIPLLCSVLGGCLIASLMAGLSKYFGGLQIADIVLIWCFDLIGFGILDFLKVGILAYFDERTEVLPEQVETGSISNKPGVSRHHNDVENGFDMSSKTQEKEFSRASVSTHRLSEWAVQNNERFSSMGGPVKQLPLTNKPKTTVSSVTNKTVRESMGGRLSMSFSGTGGVELRPNLPANRYKH
jgi:hypothetical protein